MTLLALSLMLFLGCSSESENLTENSKSPNFRVYESVIKGINNVLGDRAAEGEYCATTNLIAGQHHIAGTVTVENDGENLIITYTTNEDWTIDLTHMSIGDCEQSIPTTGSGNPKVGHFEHTEPHSADTNQVIYMVSLDIVPENYCFAAHAEVHGPTGGETAWAEGPGFDGNSWAMYVEAFLSDCPGSNESDEGEPGGDYDEE